MAKSSFLEQPYLSDKQKELQALARDFATERVLPLARALDHQEEQFPDELITEMGRIGFFGIMIPEEHGGLGLGAVEYALVTEELSRAWMSVGSVIRCSALPPKLDAARRAELLPRGAAGQYLGAFSLSEAEAGSDVANISCKAIRDGDDWIINGSKMWCTFADRADFIVLFARTSPPTDPERRHKGISAFLIEKQRGTFPDGMTGTAVRKIGYHGWKTFELSFDHFRLPGNALIGDEGEGFYAGMTSLEIARIHTAARAVGVARGALEDASAYAMQRVQFGQPIADFQAVRFRLANMAVQIEAARQLTFNVARMLDAGQPCRVEASMAKYFASEMAETVTSDAIQVFGGAGYTRDFSVERYWRDARLTKIFEGTSDIQLKIISDHALARPAGGSAS